MTKTEREFTVPTHMLRDLAAYHPCESGVHVCDMNHDENRFFTICNFPCASRSEFERARALFASQPGEPEEVIIDWNEQHFHMDDFCITRQMLNRVKAFFSEGCSQ